MCGICGFTHTKNGDINTLKLMQKQMTHRGPDSMRSLHQNNAFIGFNRLSIIDLSDHAMQPMYAKEQGITLSFNGEIYNFQTLRLNLEKKGYNFNSQGDAEVLLYTYLEFGLEETLQKINGMFAISIYHEKEDKLILARDRMGKKPLYYQYFNKALIYASELNVLQKHPDFINELEPQNAHQYFIFSGLPAPYTMYKNIHKLKAGHYLIFEKGNIKIKKYWELNYLHKNQNITQNEASEQFHELLSDSFSIRKYADVPKALYLSGGIDSTILSKLFFDQKLPITCISSTFENKKANEEKYIDEVLKKYHFNSKKLQIKLPHEEMIEMLTNLDEPFADPAILPMIQMSKLVSDLGYKVVFTGDGGDELLGGYHSKADYSYKLQWLYKTMTPHNIHHKNFKVLKYLNPKYKSIYGFMKHRLKLVEHTPYLNLIDETLEPIISKTNSYLEFKQLYSVFNMQNNYNYKTDRGTMAHSLEARSPLQDYRLYDFISTLPVSYYSNVKKRGKIFLKDKLEEDFPSSFVYRKKQGFGVPIGDYLKNQPIEEYIKIAMDYLNIPYVKNLYEDTQYNLFTLGLWLKNNA